MFIPAFKLEIFLSQNLVISYSVNIPIRFHNLTPKFNPNGGGRPAPRAIDSSIAEASVRRRAGRANPGARTLSRWVA